MKSKFLFLLGGIFLVVIIIIILLIIPVNKLENNETLPEQLDKIQKFIIDGKQARAKELLHVVVENKITQSDLLLKLAKIYLLLGDKSVSAKLIEKAWRYGAKQPNSIILLLITHSDLNKKVLYSYISRYLEELPDTRTNDLFRADIYQDLNHSAEAQTIWLRYFNDKYNSSIERARYAVKIAQSFILENKMNDAINIMRSANKQDCMNLASYNLFISLCLMTNNSEQAKELLCKAIMEYTSKELQFKDALISLYMGELVKSEQKLNKLQIPSTSSVSDLATQYNARMYLALLRIMKNGKNAFFLDLIYNSKESRTYLNKNKGISKLLKLYIAPEILEAETLFYTNLANLIKGKPNAFEIFKSKNSLYPNHPVVDFIILKLSLSDNNDAVAVAKIKDFLSVSKLSMIEGGHGLFILSPASIASMSQVLYTIGAYKDAEKLLTSLTDRKKYTAKTINMLLKLAIKTNNKKLLNMLLALKEIDQCVDFEILKEIVDKPVLQSQLCKQGIFKVIFLANDGKIDEALKLCDSIKLPKFKKTLLEAQIKAMGGDIKTAEKLFKESLNAKNNFWGYREYAKFLILHKRYNEAEKLYREILVNNPDDIVSIIGVVNLLELNNKIDEAEKWLNKHIVLDNSDIFLKLTKLNIKKTNYPMALKYVNKVLRSLGKNDEAIFYKTIALIGVYQQYPTNQNKIAVKKMSAFLKKFLFEKNSLIFTAYIEALYSLKEYSTLLANIDIVKIDQSNLWLLKKQIMSLLYTHKSKLAVKLLQKYDKMLERDFVMLANAELYLIKKDYEKSIALLEKSKNRNLRYKAAKLAVRAKKTDMALRIMQTLSPSYLDWGGVAQIASAENNVPFTVLCYNNALKLAPNNPLILNNYAWFGANSGALPKDKVIAMIKKAYSITATDGILDTYLFVLAKYREYKQCKEIVHQKYVLQKMSPNLIFKYINIMREGECIGECIFVMNNILQRKDLFWAKYPKSKQYVEKQLLNFKMNNIK